MPTPGIDPGPLSASLPRPNLTHIFLIFLPRFPDIRQEHQNPGKWRWHSGRPFFATAFFWPGWGTEKHRGVRDWRDPKGIGVWADTRGDRCSSGGGVVPCPLEGKPRSSVFSTMFDTARSSPNVNAHPFCAFEIIWGGRGLLWQCAQGLSA